MKTAAHAGHDILFSLVNQRDYIKAIAAIRKSDEQSADLLRKVGRQLADEMDISRGASEAFNRFRTVLENAGRWDPDLIRNNVFKAANSLGIKLPSAMFASDLSAQWGPTIPR